MKKTILIFTILLSLFLLSSCDTKTEEDNTIKVVTTLFPQYDMVRSLAGDKVELSLTLPPSVSAHTYEPTPSIVIDILSADLLIYSSDELEPWVENVIEANDTGDLKVLNLSEYVLLIDGLIDEEEEEDEDEDHDHEDGEIDPHYWSDPINAKLMVNAISKELEELLLDDQEEIKEEALKYIEELNSLNDDFLDLEEHRSIDIMMHGGHRSIGYFVERYNVTYVNPYEGFSSDAEPTPARIAYMIDIMDENNIDYLFSETLLSQTVATTIQEQTGAEILYIYSMGNLSKEEFDNGLTFLDMMKHNLEQYRIGLGYDESNNTY